MTWQPVTQADQPAPLQPLAFTLDAHDRDNAVAARYYIQQHKQRLNERDNHRAHDDEQ